MSHPLVVNVGCGDYDVYIGRPTIWGNPYRIGRDGDRTEVIEKYRKYLASRPDIQEKARVELKGKVLACHCFPQPCHGEILAAVANDGLQPTLRGENDMSLGLAWIGKIIHIEPIPEADRIELATVVVGSGGKWMGIVQKGQFQLFDSCLVYLQDALVPHTPELAFMEKYHWRIKMQRLRGVPSECLIMPQTIPGDVGTDVTELAGVTKYEKPVPACLAGENSGNFPSFIPKTDEVNFQAVPGMVEALRGKPFYATVKADGTSCTIYHKDGHIGCCSRNWEKKDNGGTVYWDIVHFYKLQDKLPALGNIAIQGEVVGPGIQKNPLGLKDVDIRVFDIWDIDGRYYYPPDVMRSKAIDLGLQPVQLVEECGRDFDMNDEALRVYAEGTYPESGKQREGVVIRSVDNSTYKGERISFKVINLKYRD